MKWHTILAIVLLILLAGVSTTMASSTHTVSPGDDIQAVIDGASPGDTILFAQGTFTLTATLDVNKALTLAAADPSQDQKPLIDGGDALKYVVVIRASDVTLDGLKIANGTGTLVNTSNDALSDVTVRNCDLHNATNYDGISLRNCTRCVVECCDIRDMGGEAIYVGGGSDYVTIRNNVIYRAGSDRAAIYVYDSAHVTVECNEISQATAANGIKFFETGDGPHTIANNLIAGNAWVSSAGCDEANGNAINIYQPKTTAAYDVRHNTLADNSDGMGCDPSIAHGVYVDDGEDQDFTTTVRDNIIANHGGYGIRAVNGAYVGYEHNDLWQNTLGATDGNPVDQGNNIEMDPSFEPDYTLATGSPCIGRASDGKDMGRVFDACGCGSGQLQVVKAVDPAADPGRFNLQIDGRTDADAADVGDGGDTGKETVRAGAHTVGETASAGTTLDDYGTTIVCKERGGGGREVASGSDAGPLAVTVAANDDIVCTITNTRKSGDNAIQNPGFETGADPWMLYSDAPASFTIGQPGSGSDNAARVEINGWGSNVQLSQAGIALKPDTSYRVSFEAFSNTANDIHLSIHKNSPPYTNYGCDHVPFDLGANWQVHQHEFTTTGFSQPVTDARLRFWFPIGAQPGDVYWIDNVVLEEIASTATTSLEVLKDVAPNDTSQWLIDVVGASGFQEILSDNVSTGAREVEPGAYTITESGYAGTSIDDYNVSYVCSVDGVPGPSGDGPEVTLDIAQGQAVRCTFTNAHKESRANLVSNPSFEHGTTDWHFHTDGQATFTTGAPASSGAATGLLNVVSPGSNTQLYQPNINLEPNTDYQLCFDALSNSAYDVAVYLHKHTAPYTSHGVHNEVADLGNDWATFCYEFNTSMLTTPVDDGRLRFSPLGSGVHAIDNVVLQKAGPGPATSLEIIGDSYPSDAGQWEIVVAGPSGFSDMLYGDDSTGARTVDPGDYAIDATVVTASVHDTTYACTVNGAAGPSGDGTHIDVSIALGEHVVCTFSHVLLSYQPNLIRNPGFEQGTSDWAFYTNGAGSFAALSPGTGGAAAARVSFTSVASNMQLFQGGIALKPYTQYELTFHAKATAGHDMWLYLHKNGAPYTNYGLSGELVDLGEDWGWYSYQFATSGFAEPVDDGRLRFWFVGGAQAGDQYWIDEMVLTEIDPW